MDSIALSLPKLDRLRDDVEAAPPVWPRNLRFRSAAGSGWQIPLFEFGVLLSEYGARLDGSRLVRHDGADLRGHGTGVEIGVAVVGRDFGRNALDTDGAMKRFPVEHQRHMRVSYEL